MWVYNLALTVTKTSILVQYLRIFLVRRIQNGCYILLAIVIAYGTWAVFGNVFLCIPTSFAWDNLIKSGHCRDRTVLWFTNAGMNIAQDVGILFPPILLIQTLPISRSRKRGLVTMIAFSGR
jgi:hypothetical protein